MAAQFHPQPTDPFGPDTLPPWHGRRRAPLRRAGSLQESLRIAVEGVAHGFRTQRNLRLQAVLGVAAVVFGMLLRMAWHHLALVASLALLVICAELMNTAVESLLDEYVGDAFDSGVKRIKDLAAGAVLMASCGAMVVGAAVFLPAVARALAR